MPFNKGNSVDQTTYSRLISIRKTYPACPPDKEFSMFTLKSTSIHAAALAFFGLSCFEDLIANTLSTGVASLWSIGWYTISFILAFITVNYLMLNLGGRTKQAEGTLTFGIFPMPKLFYYMVVAGYAAFETIRHLFFNTASNGFSSLFHVGMLILGGFVVVFAVEGIRSLSATSATPTAA